MKNLPEDVKQTLLIKASEIEGWLNRQINKNDSQKFLYRQQS